MNVQTHLQSILDAAVADGHELGVQVAAYHRGKRIVHAWAGQTGHAPSDRVGADTLFPVFSTTKGMVATLIHLLAERGALEYETPIASIWPEFGVRGKQAITVRQALSHSAGIPQMPTGIGWVELCDWTAMCSAIADLVPLWTPGSRVEYHAMTYGWILGEVARRVDGRPFPRLLEEEICRPLGLDAMFVGLPAAAEPRVARLEQPDYQPPPPGNPRTESVPTWMGPLFAMMNRSDARLACIPASNGIMSADAIARHYAALLEGGVDGVQLLPHRRVRLATEPQTPEWRDPPDHPKAWGLGYALGGPGALFSLNPSAFGHVGYGASYGFADPDLGLAVGLTKNRFCGEALALQVADEIRRLIPPA